jgi:glycerol-3-phosphate acyltransferase PlsY
MGGRNVGALNTFREIGFIPALFVGVVDIGKGAAAVAIAFWLFQLPPLFVLLAGFAVVVGHNWMVFLRFSGGKGMATALGVLSVLMPLYGYWVGLVIFLGIIITLLVITRNVALSTGIGLVSLPFITWLGMKSGLFTAWAIATGLPIGLKFLPTAREAIAKSRDAKDFVFDRIL